MARLIQWSMVSLDGYFEGGLSWEIDWFRPLFNDELQSLSLEQLRHASALLFDRVTYEGMADYWQTASGEVATYMNKLPKIIFSTTLERAGWANTRLVTSLIGTEVSRLKHENPGDLYVCGSGKLCATMLGADLFDEIRLWVMPIVLGHGLTLFGRGMDRVRMKLLEAKQLSNGCVILRYAPQHHK
ncbi:MAG TPA: dihydrofolate reductase family protein [Terracidiphilus sp.]|nr:dihydrofolate reductase family protein [Terracidiphilus sp.]